MATSKWEQIRAQKVSDVAAQSTQSLQQLKIPSKLPNTPSLSGLGNNEPIDEEFDISVLRTHNLMQLSGMMRAINIQKQQGNNAQAVAEWWPDGIKQTGPVPVVNLYGREPLGKSLPPPSVQEVLPQVKASEKPQLAWKALLNRPAVKVTIGLLIGVGMLFLISKFVNIPVTIDTLRKNLTTPQGIMHASLAALAFIAAFSIRGARWRLFLSRISNISTLKAIQIFWVAVFINFLLPVQGGEVAKSLMLKRVANIPISQSLPTVAMDKSLDLMPALIIMAIVPFIPGIHMNITLWLVLGLVGSILIGIIFTVALAAWKRDAAIGFIHLFLRILPKGIAAKIDGFAMGFVDSLLAGASNPKTFVPAVLLTCLAVTCDGLFAWMAFLTVGLYQMNFGSAIFGYTTYNMFSILPTPPGQVGSNEAVGVTVFNGLLGFDKQSVLAMFFFSHPLAALIMTTLAIICLSSLGLTISSALKVQNDDDEQSKKAQPQQKYEQQERQIVRV
jgi:uncharacterized protein (TIRG00374 family)